MGIAQRRTAFATTLVALIAFSIASACGGGDSSSTDAGTRPTPETAAIDAGRDGGPPRPTGPPKRLFAKRFVVNVRSQPDHESPSLGYIRAGAVVQATSAEPTSGPTHRCRGGWFELTTGGWVCNDRDVVAFEGRRLPARPPAQPDRDAPLPYRYGRARRDNLAMYRRLPTDEEAATYEGYRIPGVEPVAAEEGGAAAEGTTTEASAATEPQAPPPTPIVEEGVQPASGVAATAAVEGEVVEEETVVTLDQLQGERGGVLVRRMMKGFIVSLDRDFRTGARRYWRSLGNGYIPYFSVGMVEGSDFHGARLAAEGDAEGTHLPLGFVLSSKTTAFTRGRDGRPRRGRPPGYHYQFPVTAEETHREQQYIVASDDRLFRSDEVTVIRAATARPEGVGERETWIDIDLERQTLVAYEGLTPVYATLISSGRVRDPDDPLQNHETPVGLWRIRSKHITHTMDGDHAVDGPYSIEDVPYVMYFQLAFAVHSAFWHDGFGRPRSHGCVNVAPQDARWLFDWASPPLPEGWHAVYPDEAHPGTWIYIHGQTREG